MSGRPFSEEAIPVDIAHNDIDAKTILSKDEFHELLVMMRKEIGGGHFQTNCTP